MKAVEILERLMESREGATLKELSKAVGQNASTVHHLVSTLRQVGLLQQDPDTRAYRLGLKAFQIGQAALNHLDIAQRAQPLMRELARETGEGVSLVQYEGGAPVYVLQIDSSRTIGIRHRPSAHIPLHCSGSGKVFLSSLPADELDEVIGRLQLQRLTPATITDPVQLKDEVKQVRQQGFAVDSEEVEPGLVCIAAPIRGVNGQIVGSLSLSGPSGRVNEIRDALIERIRETARAVSFEQ